MALQMRAYELAAAVFALVSPGTIAQSQEATAVDATVWVTDASMVPSSEVRAARATVSRMFARVGFRLAWLDGKPSSAEALASPVVIYVRFVRQPMDDVSSGALAYALPFGEGAKTITILWGRIRQIAGTRPRERHILAHVLAHEIGHVLRGTNGHAQTGVMKAYWNEQDLDAMEKGPLEFTSTDVELIREGLNHMKARARLQAGD
jgi:hypothetical protein